MAELVTQSGKVANPALTNLDILDSADIVSIANSTSAATAVFDTLDSLPTSGLSAGQQAFVNGNNRLYISNGTGWYNLTFVNRTPTWLTEPDASYTISDSATPLLVTAKATDSDNSDINLLNQSFGTDSAQYMVNISTDSSVWTFTPKSADSIGIEVAAGNLTDSNGDFVYTFKWSDGINFVTKAVTIEYNPAGGGGGVWYGVRGLSMGGSRQSNPSPATDIIEYITITTPGNAQDFGDLLTNTSDAEACGNGTRALYMGGSPPSGIYAEAAVIQYVTTATLGDAINFGNLTDQTIAPACLSDGTLGFSTGGYGINAGGITENIEYVTIETTGDATNFGDCLFRLRHHNCASDATRGLIAGGYNDTAGSRTEVIQYITTATPGNSLDFGDLIASNQKLSGASDQTRSLFNHGYTNTRQDVIQYVTTQTLGNAVSFGTLTEAVETGASTNDDTYMVRSGGHNGSVRSNVIDRVTIQTPGNASDFGDLEEGKMGNSMTSGNAA